MIRPSRHGLLADVPLLIALVSLAFLLAVARAATPFNQATVTRVQNRVNYGEVRGARTIRRPASVADVVRANNYLLTETESRAELQYQDGSVVRIGQNTVFSFDAETRSLELEKGSLIFYIPKGSGGGQIKTPSLTAAITGTVGKVSDHIIAIIEGEVTLIPSGRVVPANSFARRNADGSITIAPFNPNAALEGELMRFNGVMPGVDEVRFVGPRLTLDMSQLHTIESLHRRNADPGAIREFFPEPEPPPFIDRTPARIVVPPPNNRPPVPHTPRPNGPPYG